MKKITLAVACIGLMTLSSCKKDRNCTCTTTDQNGKVEVSTVTYPEISGKDAKDACTNSSWSSSSGSNTSKGSTECKLD